MNLELHLQSTERAAQSADSWFIPGQTSQRWLEELSRTGLGESDTRLLIIPLSPTDRTPVGVVVIPGKGRSWKLKPAGFPCRWIGRHLCVPADADLIPSISPEEADGLCGNRMIFMHPSLGVSGHDPGEVAHLRQLLKPPTPAEAPWNRAHSSLRLCPALTRIVLHTLPTLPELFGEAAGQIGRLSPQDLPPTPDESAERKPSWAGQLKDLIARQLQESLPGEEREPESAAERSLLARWAHQRTQAEQDRLQKERFKELHRLLQQLEADPATGLKYAIPLKNLPHRGLATPGARLGEREADFDATSLGGGPADVWSTPTELQLRLQRSYVDLAGRELKLRNFRRAAYIYAHLLGDLVSAANALKQGGHYREAALLHEEQLRNFAEAARCLEEGDLLQEALERYEKLELWPDLARVHEKRQDTAAAHQVWRRVVAQRRAANDHLEAARILEEKLGALDEAIEELRAGWPSSPQAIGCLQLLLELGAKHGRSDETLQLLHSVVEKTGSFWRQDGFLEVMLQQAQRQPDGRVREASANLVRMAIAKRLADPRTSPRTVSKLVNHLTELAPHDRLLCRDANRYLQQRRSADSGGPSTGHEASLLTKDPAQRKAQAGVISARFRLPWTCEWRQFLSLENGFLGVGWKGPEVIIVRGSWSEGFQINALRPEGAKAPGRIILESPDRAAPLFWLRISPTEPTHDVLFPVALPHFPGRLTGCNPSWLDTSTESIFCTASGVWSLRRSNHQVILSHHDSQGNLLLTSDLSQELLPGLESETPDPLCLTSFKGGVAVGLQNRLLIQGEDGIWQPRTLPGSVRSLHPNDLPHRSELTVVLAEGIARCDLRQPEIEVLEEGTAGVLFAQLSRNRAVWVCSEAGYILNSATQNSGNAPRRFSIGRREIMAILPTDQPDHFALIDRTGLVTIHHAA